MATRNSQRIGIWVIVVVMTVGTLGAFFLPILINSNATKDSEQQTAALKELQDKQNASNCPVGEVADKKVSPAPTPPAAPTSDKVAELSTSDVTVGTGAEVKAGDCVEVLYHGTLAKDGKAFDGGDNYASGVPYRSLTTGFVKGFGAGLVGMKVGGERLISIPSEQAYGAQAQGDIPANADLVFAIQLIGIYTP